MALFGLCRGTDWHTLPEAGGWLDQPDWFVHDAVIISRRLEHLRGQKNLGNKKLEELRKKLGIKR